MSGRHVERTGARPVATAPARANRPRRSSWRQVLATAALLASASRITLAGPETLPPDHWAYDELEHFEARGFLVLDDTRPYSRQQVQRWVEALAECSPGRFTATESARLSRLDQEFGAADSLLAERFDPPVLRLADSGWHAGGDVQLASGARLARESGGDPATSWGQAAFEVTIGHRSGFVYETRYRTVIAEETGERTGENRVSARERTWHGFTSENDRAYVAFERGPLRVGLGRDYLTWGAGRGEELLVTQTGGSFDAVQARLRLGRFLLSGANAILSSDTNRRYAAHRLEIAAGRFRLGFQEAVVYVSSRFEPAYLLPVAFFYGNQFNERGDDNVLLGMDSKWAGPWGVLEGELMIDDFIYDGDPAPQKVAWRVGARRSVALGETDLDLRLGYLRINRWTYTHRQPAAAYVAGNGTTPNSDPLLGHALGPDADRWSLELQWRPRLSTHLYLLGTHTRRGEGNADRTAWLPGEPYGIGFPSGDVLSGWGATAGGSLQLGHALQLHAAAGAEQRGSAWDTQLRAEVRLDP